MSPRSIYTALARYTAHRISLSLQSLNGDLLSTAQAKAVPMLVLVWLFFVANQRIGNGQLPIQLLRFLCPVEYVCHLPPVSKRDTTPVTAD